MRITVIVFFLLFTCSCAQHSFVVATKRNDGNNTYFLKSEIIKAIKVPEYDTSLKPGQCFAMIFSPGIPFSKGDLSFATIPNALELPKEADKAYLFSKLVNSVILSVQFGSATPVFSSNPEIADVALS